MKRILVIGSANVDMTTYVDHFPEVKETIIGNHFNTSLGGKGLNQAMAAYYLGADVSFFGCVANDANGKMIKDFCYEEGITSFFKESDIPTGIASITVDKDGENKIIVVPGANLDIQKSDISIDLIKAFDIILVQFEIPYETIKQIIQLTKKAGKIIVVNPAPVMKIEDSILKDIDFLIPNESEIVKLANGETIADMAYELLNKGVKNVIVTLGADGAVLYSQEKEIIAEGKVVDAIDSTGAGDCFVGSFAYELSAGSDLDYALNNANHYAAISVTKKGAINSFTKLI